MNTQRGADAFSDLTEAFRDFATSLGDLAREVSQRAYELRGGEGNEHPRSHKTSGCGGKTNNPDKRLVGRRRKRNKNPAHQHGRMLYCVDRKKGGSKVEPPSGRPDRG